MLGLYVFVTGILMLITPIVMVLLSGAKTEEDVIRWFYGLPDKIMILMGTIVVSGVSMVMLSLAIWTLI